MKERRVVELPVIIIPQNKPQQKQLRVAAYCRVSTEQEAQQNSFQAQKEYYTAKINANPDWMLAGIFADEGITGTSVQQRNDFKKMIQYCERGKIDLILTKSISRFARNTVDCLLTVRRLSQLGVSVIFETENINTATMESEFILAIMGAMYQAESEATSSRVKWGIRAGFREGRVRYSYKNWLGYRKGEDGQPEIVPEEAVTIKLIFDLFLAGNSLNNIVQELEKQGIAKKSGSTKWSINYVWSILNNEKYTGDAILQKTYAPSPLEPRRKNLGEVPMYLVENAHPAIISRDTFRWTKAELERRRAARNRKMSTEKAEKKTYSSKYALSEILVCGECNSPYSRVLWINTLGRRFVWRCKNRLCNGKKYCRNSPTLDELQLHRILVEVVNQHLHHPDYLLAPFDQMNLSRPTAAKNMSELYSNLRASQYAIDERFIDLVMEYAEKQDEDIEAEAFTRLLKRRQEDEQVIELFHLQQYDQECSQRNHWLPYQLTEYHDTIIRLLVDTIKVVDKNKLIIIFKSGLEEECKI